MIRNTSPHNLHDGWPERLAGLTLCDVTLRDGEQAVDAAFTPAERLEVLTLLDASAVLRVQVGFAGRDERTVRSAKVNRLRVPLELLVIISERSWERDIEAAIESGVDAIHLLIRSWDPLLAFMGMSRDDVRQRTAAAVRHARERGAATVVYGPSFATQAEPDFLLDLYRVAEAAGATEFVINDSLGVIRPDALRHLVKEVAQVVSGPVGVHCHNDFGLAVAGSLAAAEAGATRLDVCVNGLGERGGNASLEQVVLALTCLYGVDLGIRTEGLYQLSQRVAEILRLPLPSSQPIVGDNAFAQKLDIHVRVAAERPDLFEPYDPALVGNRRRVRLGKGSGAYALTWKLRELGLNVPEGSLPYLVEWVNRTAEREKGFVSDAALAEAAAAASRPRK